MSNFMGMKVVFYIVITLNDRMTKFPALFMQDRNCYLYDNTNWVHAPNRLMQRHVYVPDLWRVVLIL